MFAINKFRKGVYLGHEALHVCLPLPGPPSLCMRTWAHKTLYRKIGVSVGTSRSRPPVKLQYEPRIHTVQHGYGVCALNTVC